MMLREGKLLLCRCFDCLLLSNSFETCCWCFLWLPHTRKKGATVFIVTLNQLHFRCDIVIVAHLMMPLLKGEVLLFGFGKLQCCQVAAGHMFLEDVGM